MRQIPGTDLQVFPLCLGGNVFGWTADEREVLRGARRLRRGRRQLHRHRRRLLGAGSPGNQGGESETIIGSWMAARGNRERHGHRDQGRHAQGPYADSRAENIRAAADASLRRLRIDDDRPLLRPPGRPGHAARGDARRVRRARHGGQGPPHRGLQLHGAAARRGARDRRRARACRATSRCSRTTTWSIAAAYEGELEPSVCAREDLACLPYYALASGFLTGKYRAGRRRSTARAQAARRRYLDERGAARARRARRGRRRARDDRSRRSRSPGCAAQPTVVAPIASARTVEQLEQFIGFPSLELSSDELAQLSAASAG